MKIMASVLLFQPVFRFVKVASSKAQCVFDVCDQHKRKDL